MFRFAPEGYSYIFFFLTVSVIAAFFSGWAAVVPALITLFMLYFFRDPERAVPEDRDVFVSPADGKIILIREVTETHSLWGAAKEVSIFMSPFDVHVNRAPCDGTVRTVVHHKGGFMAAYREEASLRNENIEMLLETRHGNILVRQVAGFLARRAVCRKATGDVLRRGERYGMIKFSSRVDIYLPKDAEIRVQLGERVRAGETVLGSLPRE